MAGKPGNLGKTVMKALGFLLLLGLLVAILRVFNWNPFGVVDWIWNWFMKIINSISDFFTGSDWFREATQKPH